MKKRPARTKRNYEFSKQAITVLDRIKKTPEIKLNDFVSEAVIHYAKKLAEQGDVETGSEELEMERRINRLEEHLYSLHLGLLKERIGHTGVKKAQEFFRDKGLTEESKLSEVRKELLDTLGNKAPKTQFECKVLIREANKPKKKTKT